MFKKYQEMKGKGGFTLIELMIVVAILGILAVVAIPAFVRYMRKAKTAEALRMMNKVEQGVYRYYSKSWPNTNGTPQKCQFPTSTGITPGVDNAYYCCTDGEADGKCEPNETSWNSQTWQALLFKISDKHYYQFDFQQGSTAVGNGATYTIWAVGDLDCDGTYASFKQQGTGFTSDTNEILNCRVQKAAGVSITNESE